MSENIGIPTLYKDIQFRSRLEARWAAFFDLLGWRWEYEPYDLPGWIPDFIIPCPGTGYGRKNILVEVKPIDNFDEFKDEEKIINALKNGWDYGREILVLGYSVSRTAVCNPIEGSPINEFPRIGFLGEFIGADVDYLFYDAIVCKYQDSWGLHHAIDWRINRITGKKDLWGKDVDWNRDEKEVIKEVISLWAKAGNTVQWKPAK